MSGVDTLDGFIDSLFSYKNPFDIDESFLSESFLSESFLSESEDS